MAVHRGGSVTLSDALLTTNGAGACGVFAAGEGTAAALPNFLCQFSAVLPDRRDHPELLAELSALDGVILIEEI